MTIQAHLDKIKARLGRLSAAGSWNSMVTHRVRVGRPDEINAELLAWLRQAYDAV